MAEQFSLMAIYAHPDDEQGVSGAFAKYKQLGVETTLLCATRGEAGEIAPGTNATPETLGQAREAELRCAAEKLGVDALYFLDYRDSGMMGAPANNHPRSLHQADWFEVTEKVTRIIRRARPQVLLTFDAWGGYGHPDHIKMHQAALMAFFVAGDARAYPRQLNDEGLSAWAPQKLYVTAFTRARFERYFEAAEAAGVFKPEMKLEFLRRAVPDEAVTTRIDVSAFVDLKVDALMCHATQLGPNTLFAKIPMDVRREMSKIETFMLVEARGLRPQGVETDLFEGVTQETRV